MLVAQPVSATEPPSTALLEGVVTDHEGNPLPYTTIYVSGTTNGTTADSEGRYRLTVEQGERDIVVQMLGYATEQKSISVAEGRNTLDVALRTEATGIEQVVVSASGVGHLRRSAFNAVAVDTKSLQNTTQSISDAMSRAPGIRLRESGGVGSDMSLSVDGFSGKHVKIFIDGVPQEGVGGAFSLNNIPAGYAG